MTPEDADVAAAIERECFAIPWSRESFWREAANENTLYLLVLHEGTPIGFAGCWLMQGEAQITNVAILPEHRGKGAATALMAKMIEKAKERGATAMTLEVRPSNVPALALYAKFGFKSVGRRPKYYQDNGEDAIIMWNTQI
ncbi:MAG: ribosomal protein S18-alanine N-acetyltransferase [Selenomonadaceae bacterium]|nr:ribosomal protein S18-alanine N-acetyltransferase [Selenomonadaceae bacterium]